MKYDIAMKMSKSQSQVTTWMYFTNIMLRKRSKVKNMETDFVHIKLKNCFEGYIHR